MYINRMLSAIQELTVIVVEVRRVSQQVAVRTTRVHAARVSLPPTPSCAAIQTAAIQRVR